MLAASVPGEALAVSRNRCVQFIPHAQSVAVPAAGGSPLIQNSQNSLTYGGIGDQSIVDNPKLYDLSIEGPFNDTVVQAGNELEVELTGFYHPSVMRFALCYQDGGDCNEMTAYEQHVLGFAFTEGAAGVPDMYSGVLKVKVTPVQSQSFGLSLACVFEV